MYVFICYPLIFKNFPDLQKIFEIKKKIVLPEKD